MSSSVQNSGKEKISFGDGGFRGIDQTPNWAPLMTMTNSMSNLENPLENSNSILNANQASSNTKPEPYDFGDLLKLDDFSAFQDFFNGPPADHETMAVVGSNKGSFKLGNGEAINILASSNIVPDDLKVVSTTSTATHFTQQRLQPQPIFIDTHMARRSSFERFIKQKRERAATRTNPYYKSKPSD